MLTPLAIDESPRCGTVVVGGIRTLGPCCPIQNQENESGGAEKASEGCGAVREEKLDPARVGTGEAKPPTAKECPEQAGQSDQPTGSHETNWQGIFHE